MATFYGNETLEADFFKNLATNLIPTSLTVTPWQCKLAKKIFSVTGDPKMKSFSGPQGWNVWVINEMFKHYKVTPTATYVQEKTKVSPDVATAFVRNIDEYKGKDVREGLAAKAIDLVSDVAEGAGDLAKDAPAVLSTTMILLAVGVAGYLIFAGRKGVRLLP